MKIILFLILITSYIFAVGFTEITAPTVEKYKEQNQKLSYSEMLAYLKNSNDKEKLMVLGVLYSKTSDTPDDFGEYIKVDTALAQKYLLKAYEMGNFKSIGILGALIMYNDDMAKLDPKLVKAEKYLETAYGKGVQNVGIILANAQLIRGKYKVGLNTLFKLSEKGDSSAQLQLALIMQKGMFSKEQNKMVIQRDPQAAEMFLNKACNNENKDDKVREFCQSLNVITE